MRKAGFSLGWFATLAVLAILADCRPSSPLPVIEMVTVAGTAPLEPFGLRSDVLRRATEEALSSVGFRIKRGEGAPEGVKVSAKVLEARLARRAFPDSPSEAEELRIEVAVSLRLTRPNQDRVEEVGRWSEPVKWNESRTEALKRALNICSHRAAASLQLALAEMAKPDQAVIADLEHADSRVRDQAIRVLAERKNPTAVPALIARLRDSDPELAERAVGALDQIGDPRAVEPLIELSHRREGPFVARLARIIGDLGGPEAEAYLMTLASGHRDPEVRQAAALALEQSRARRAAPADTPGDR